MHTCISLSNAGPGSEVERAVGDLLSRIGSYCDSIDWCNVAVAGPSGEGEARTWRVDLKLCLFDAIVRASSRIAEGADPARSLSQGLSNVYERATVQMAHIAKDHQGCCTHGTDRSL